MKRLTSAALAFLATAPALGDATLLRAGNKTLALGSDGRLHLLGLSPKGLEIVSTARIFAGRSWTAPALAGTRLSLRDRAEIVALELGAEVRTP